MNASVGSEMVHAPDIKGEIIRVPDKRVLAMIASCAEQISRVSTITDALEVTDVAEAIAAVAHKIKVTKAVRDSAVLILVEAESKLGEITRAIPHAKAGGGKKADEPRKSDVLRENGISKIRANLAERLAATPKKKIEEVIAVRGAKTLHAVFSKLDFQTDNYTLRKNRASNVEFLCEEAVSLLERCVKRDKVPHAGTVAEMVRRFKNITQHGNRKAE